MNKDAKGALAALRSSLPLKVLAVLVLAGATMNVLLVQGYRLAREAELHRNGTSLAVEYGRVIVRDLGNPPQEDLAQKIADKGIWQFRFQPKPGASTPAWATDPELPTAESVQQRLGKDSWGREHGVFQMIAPYRDGTLLMQAKPYGDMRLGWPWVTGLCLSLFGVLFIVWVALRWLLLPVDWLNRGMEKVAQGDLDHRIPTRDTDELGRLAQQFNGMTGQVKAMLDQRRQLLLDVSHELRTPITRLKLGLETLEEGPERQSLTEDVSALELLVSELLEGARLAHGRTQLQMETVDLASLVRDGGQEFQDQSPGLQWEVPESLVIQGDALRLQRVMLNLIKNALTHGQPARGPVSVRVARQGNQAVVTVEDQGPGLSVDLLERLFTPFFRVDASRNRGTGGVGLGLHLCQGVARAHGGDLTVAIGPSRGLVFTLVLPVQ